MSRHRAVRPVRARFACAWAVQPYSLTIACVLTPVGALALVTGDRVSSALSILGAGIVSRVMGAFLLAGGALMLAGVARRSATAHAMGLVLLSAGTGIYGLGVILGLGWAGCVAGPGYLAMTVAQMRRVQIILALADEPPPEPWSAYE